ncbi:DUF1150 family protein [Pelagibacterium montanilacus]|uniref:DUF1150 family protein n=1 Tax=Pelagibacterium montanilacus TaxID=2185280 RepID=UPI000F8C38EF|nr:DUF1150 family protein [Pelagibacterium montanilacus]
MNKPLTGTLELEAGAPALKLLTADQFAALGAGDIVFWRRMKARDLVDLVPQAAMAPDEQELEFLVSADGAPVLIADSRQAIIDWIDGHEVRLATLH